MYFTNTTTLAITLTLSFSFVVVVVVVVVSLLLVGGGGIIRPLFVCLFVCLFVPSSFLFILFQTKTRESLYRHVRLRVFGTKMRFAHGWPIERVSPLLSSSSLLSRASSEAPRDTDTDDDDGVRARGVAPSSSSFTSSSRVVAATLDATSRTLAIVTSSGIELWDSGRNRVVLCEKRKPKTASEYIHAEWKPNYHVRGEDGTRDEDDDENASASHKERTLLVMTKSGNLLVFLVSVGKVDEFSGGSGRSTNEKSTTRNASAGSEQQCGDDHGRRVAY